jgi:hypothetical protein
MQELDLRIRQFDEDHRHAVLRLRGRRRDAGPERLAISVRRLFEVRDGDGDVVQLSDHGFLRKASGERRAEGR